MSVNKKLTPVAESQALLRPKETADLLGVSERYLSALSRRGELPLVRMGKRAVRYSRSDVAAFIDRRRSVGQK
jgi:excisionase family DNA binding protein